MGRKKKDGPKYMERTCSFTTRSKKELVEQFLELFHDEKVYRKSTGKSYFLNSAMEEMIEHYISVYAPRAEIRKQASRLADEREEINVKIVVERALAALAGDVPKCPTPPAEVAYSYMSVPKE